MRLSVLPFALSYIAAILALASQVSAADFLDDFSADTSADYLYTSTYGTDTASWNVSGDTLNLPVTGGGNQTANLFYDTATLAVGETVSIDLSGASDTYLTVSTTRRGPNTSGEDGVRFNWESDGTFRARRYTNGNETKTNFDSSFDTGASSAVTLYLTRESDNTFSAAYDSGSGLTQLNTTGGTEQQTFTAGDTGNGDLYIGVETFGSGTRSFDNLRVGILAEQPILSSFTASATTISEAGDVTFTWSASNASTVTLNGQDVTGQSPYTVLVNQTQDFTLVVTSDSGATLSQVLRVAIGESFSIAAVADPQYADVPVGWRGGGRQPEEGVNRLSHAVTQYNHRTLDWGVIVGDLIDFDDIDYGNPPPGEPSATGTQDWSNADAILGAWEQLDVPSYLVLGNHEYYVPNVDVDGLEKPYSVYRKFGFKDRAYYDFRHKGFRFVVLDGDNCYLNFAPSLPGYQDALAYYQDLSGSQKQWWNAGISIDQRKWLMDVLDESIILDEPVVIMCHYPIHKPVNNHSLLNSTELLNIVDGYSNVVMWLNGHHHSGSYATEGRRHHLGLKGMQEGADRWYQLDFSPSQITVYQAENTTTPVYDLDISRPIPSLSRPTGFAVANVSGAASLTWDAEPAEATNVVIERRHVSTLTAEWPSTAQTLSWQTVATLAIPTTQSYLDDLVDPITEYKYRIRFLAGAEGSHVSQALAPDEVARISYEEYAASLGAGYEQSGADADGDGKPNALEYFYGTPLGTTDRDGARELTITSSPTGATQLLFSYDVSALATWDIALSSDLIDWKTISEEVDYRVVQTEQWSPVGTSQHLTRVTIETMDDSSFDFDPSVPSHFFKLAVTPSL